MNRQFPEKEVQLALKHIKKMLSFTHNEENANTIFHFSDWQKSRTLIIHSVALRKKALSYIAGESINWLNS